MSSLKDFFTTTGRKQTFSKKQTIIRCTPSQKYIFYIAKGYVGFCVGTQNQLQIVLKKGEVFPISSYDDPTSSYAAMTEVTVFVLPKKKFFAALSEDILPPEEVVKILSRKIASYKERVAILTTVNVYERVIRWMIFATRYFRNGNKIPIEIPLIASQTDLASALATTRETINRSFSKLESKKLIHMKGNVVRVPSLKTLQKELASL